MFSILQDIYTEEAGSCDNSMFKLLRNCQTVLQSRGTVLQSYQRCTAHSPSTTYYHSILVGVRWSLTVVCICLFLTDNHGEYLFLSSTSFVSTLQPHELVTSLPYLSQLFKMKTLMMLLKSQCILLRVHPFPAPYPAFTAQHHHTFSYYYHIQMYPLIVYNTGFAGFQIWYK